MKKIAIFTEGQSELIFIRNLLLKLINNNELGFECFKLNADSYKDVPYKYNPPNAKIFFLIINVQNDSKVTSAIKERGKNLFERGYELVIGVRGMYSEAYDKQARGKIDNKTTAKVRNLINREIGNMNGSRNILIFFAIMEFESWLLSMYNLFCKINGKLTIYYIEEKIGFNLKNIDPQTTFYRPSNILKRILELCCIDYDKSEDIIEKITSPLDKKDFDNACENNRCKSFNEFYTQLVSISA
jgi:hypothetical protein